MWIIITDNDDIYKALTVTITLFLIDSCTVAPDFQDMANGCRGFYSFFNEDTGQYDPGWKYLSNESLYNPPFTYKSWEYATSTELDTYPFVGK